MLPLRPPPGLYERLITKGLNAELAQIEREGGTVVHRHPVDPAEAHATLARHIGSVVANALEGLPEKERRTRQPEIANRIVELLAGAQELKGAVGEADAVAIPPEEFHSIRPATGDPAPHPFKAISAGCRPPARPRRHPPLGRG